MNPSQSPESRFTVIADVWDHCAQGWSPGDPVPSVKAVKDVVASVYREGMPASAWKAAAISKLCGNA
ncbi:MAG: hypothetical protein AB7O49_20245 [Sphingomonadales bacterium]